MRGILAIRRIGVGVVAAAALAAAAAAPASAMVGPACETRLALADVGTSASCGFDTSSDWALISVQVQGTVTATVRCFTSYGTYETSRTVSANSNWTTHSPGSCSLILTSQAAGTTASGAAAPFFPIYDGP